MLLHPQPHHDLLRRTTDHISPHQSYPHQWSPSEFGLSTPVSTASPQNLSYSFQPEYPFVPSHHQGPYSYGTSLTLDEQRAQVVTPRTSSTFQELMQAAQTVAPNSWNFLAANGSVTSNPRRSHNRQHHRASSLSSIGSTGPSSPYSHNVSSPQIILPSDSALGDAYYDNLTFGDQTSYNQYQKPLPCSTIVNNENFLFGYNSYLPHLPQSNFIDYMALQKQQDEELMPAPEALPASRPAGPTKTESSSSSVAGDARHELIRQHSSLSAMPKLDRTMSDAYNDELYNPNLAFVSAPSSAPVEAKIVSPSQEIFTQRLQAANSQHLSASVQPAQDNNDRGRSPFRQGSSLAPTTDTYGARLGSAQSMREQRKAENDARVLAQQIQRSAPAAQITPNTISPKEALLDFHETDETSSKPLFPPQKSPQYRMPLPSFAKEPSQSDTDDTASQQSFASMATTRRESSSYSGSSQPAAVAQQQQQSSGFSFVPPSVPGTVKVPQQYPFVPQQRREPSNMSTVSSTPDFPSTLTSMESSHSDYTPDTSVTSKPAGATADSGTYTCTYHGCTLRFETPAKLQKHKREGHRQSVPLNPVRSQSPSDEEEMPESGQGMTSAALLRNSQAGPHKCERINPSTGKPCNTIFSRPYDLTRHEDTIHNARKQKVRCHLCTEEKTFSRNDALTRHMRVVHPEVDFPGKTRRRGHD